MIKKITTAFFMVVMLAGCTPLDMNKLMALYGPPPKIEANQCRVAHVTDGNIFTCIKSDRQPVLVKLSGIMAPGLSQPLGTEAMEALQSLIINQDVRLDNVSIDQSDKYKRTLATVYNKDNININHSMINQGYALVNSLDSAQEDPLYPSLQSIAIKNSVGLWSSENIAATQEWQKQEGGSKRKSSIEKPKAEYRLVTPKVAAPVVLAEPKKAEPRKANVPPLKRSSGFSCGSKRTCGQMNSCAEARFYLNQCGLRRLDRDNDGIPCESICGG